jgi:hypothetical protein
MNSKFVFSVLTFEYFEIVSVRGAAFDIRISDFGFVLRTHYDDPARNRARRGDICGGARANKPPGESSRYAPTVGSLFIAGQSS